MGIQFRLNLEFENDEERDFRQTTTHSFYETTDLFGGWYEPYLRVSGVDAVARSVTVDTQTSASISTERPRDVDAFIEGRRAGRTMSTFIANLMPEPITRGRR